MNNCKNCRFYDTDYKWNGKVKVNICRKGHSILLHLPFNCKYFEKYIHKTYVEKFTECDKCEYITECKDQGNVVNCSMLEDKFQHYMRGIHAYCRKENEIIEILGDKKLSEIINMGEQGSIDLNDNKQLIKRAIEMFGDITYKEFITEKFFKVCEDLYNL